MACSAWDGRLIFASKLELACKTSRQALTSVSATVGLNLRVADSQAPLSYLDSVFVDKNFDMDRLSYTIESNTSVC